MTFFKAHIIENVIFIYSFNGIIPKDIEILLSKMDNEYRRMESWMAIILL